MQLGALHVPNEWPLTDEFNSRVSKTGVSAYLRELVERDLSGASETPVATSATILSDLCRTLRPDVVDDMTKHLEKLQVSQPALLARLLEQLSESLDDMKSYGEEHWAEGTRPRVIVKFLPESARTLKTEVTYPEKPGSSSMVALKSTTHFSHTLYRITDKGLTEETTEPTEMPKPPAEKLSSPQTVTPQPEARRVPASPEVQKRKRAL